MVRNLCNYLTPSVQDAPQSKHYRQKEKRINENGQTAIQNNNNKNHQDIHAKTYNDRNSKPQQKRRLGTVCKSLNGVDGGRLNRFYLAITLALSSGLVYTRNLFSPREGLTDTEPSNNLLIHNFWYLINSQLNIHCLCRGEERPLKSATRSLTQNGGEYTYSELGFYFIIYIRHKKV